MMVRKCQFAVMAMAVASMPLLADGDYAVTVVASAPRTFTLYTSAAAVPTYALTAGALSSPFLLTYREGESVSVTSPGGTTTALTGVGGTIAYTPASGGLWTFTNSNGETARVGVGWSVHDDGFAPTTGDATFAAETMTEGPDRELKKREAPPVAYSGDDWAGDLSSAAKMTFTPPQGSGLEPTVWSTDNGQLESGNAAKVFTFSATGAWTVSLAFADGTEKTAKINIVSAGFSVFIR